MDRVLTEIQVLWANTMEKLTINDIIDILIVAFMIYNVLQLTRETRANQVLKGVGIILVAYWISDIARLQAFHWIMNYIMDAGAVVLVVLFQPELRRALEKIGRRTGLVDKMHHQNDVDEVDRMIEEIIRCMEDLSKRKVGVLIVVEHKTALGDIIETGNPIDSIVSAPLLENIFEPNTPLHDGATVIRGTRIVAAGCFLPLTEENSISKQLGTRHRAAIGVTENTDATSLVVSEETGTMSMARGGKLTRHMDAEAIRTVLHGIYDPEKESVTGVLSPVLSKWRSKK
ncbi:MAG: diadenylate cyclase CdaA [Candidatus Spyradocola sp.]|jgi:diadenylate cyclase